MCLGRREGCLGTKKGNKWCFRKREKGKKRMFTVEDKEKRVFGVGEEGQGKRGRRKFGRGRKGGVGGSNE